jgi:hypothetical protein
VPASEIANPVVEARDARLFRTGRKILADREIRPFLRELYKVNIYLQGHRRLRGRDLVSACTFLRHYIGQLPISLQLCGLPIAGGVLDFAIKS